MSVDLVAAERLPPGAASCGGCHASGPVPGHADAPPVLAEIPAAKIAAAMDAFRGGTRQGTVMPKIARGFSQAEAEAIARALGRTGTNP